MPLLQIARMPVNRGECGIVSRMGESGYCTQLLRLFVRVVRRSLQAGIHKPRAGAARCRTCVA